MKKGKMIFICICVFFIAILFLGIIIDIDFKKNVIKINDKSLYEISEYYFLPKYNEFDYRGYVNEFYVYDSSKTFSGGSVSYVLELKFTTKQIYSEFIEFERNRYEYTNSSIYTKNDYDCYLCLEEEITQYYYGAEMPYALGMLCLNEIDMKVRYLYYINIEGTIDKHFNIVFISTNCDW